MDQYITGSLIKELREKKGLTQIELAQKLAISDKTVSKWESGDSHPDIVNCIKLASLYKVSLDELVNKPLHAVQKNDFLPEDDKICGVLDVSDGGKITLPEPVLEMFDIKCGDKVLLLADKSQGLALVKCSQF